MRSGVSPRAICWCGTVLCDEPVVELVEGDKAGFLSPLMG